MGFVDLENSIAFLEIRVYLKFMKFLKEIATIYLRKFSRTLRKVRVVL